MTGTPPADDANVTAQAPGEEPGAGEPVSGSGAEDAATGRQQATPGPTSHKDPFVLYLERVSLQESLADVAENEFVARAKLISDSHIIYSNIAHRFVSLLEADTALARQVLQSSSSAPVYHSPSYGGDHLNARRSARSTSPASCASPTTQRHHHSLFLSATKLDQTDPWLVASHSMSPPRRPAVGGERGPSASPVSADRSAAHEERRTSVAHLKLSHAYQTRRRECTVRRLGNQVATQSTVVSNFQEREARRAEAFRRREAKLLQRAFENESKNSAAATERGRLELKHFNAAKPLRLKVESKAEACRITLKKNVLQEQATARAARLMDFETKKFVEEKKKMFEQHMAALQDVAHMTHRQQTADCAKSKALLGHVLVNRNIQQGRYQRVFHQHMNEILGARKRQDYEDICDVLRARYSEPVGVEVAWSTGSSSGDEDAATLARDRETPPRPTIATGLQPASSGKSQALSVAKYAQLCGAKESAVRGLAGGGVVHSASNITSPSLYAEMLAPVVRGATHVGWR